MSNIARVLSTILAGGVLTAGCLTLTAAPAAAETCLPNPIPGLPEICIPDIPVPGTEITATTPAAITGTPKVGQVLTATVTWSNPLATTTYQWQQSGVAIADATAETYTVRPVDVGKQLTVVATGAVPLLTSGASTSAPVTGVLGDPITATAPPTITGTPVVGKVLTATPGTWDGTPTPTFAYQWYRDRVAVPGATASTYVLRAVDAGRSLALAVTATRPGYAPGVAAAGPVQVARLATTTRLALPKKVIRQGAKGLLEITLTAAGLKPFGMVRIYDGRKLLKTYTVRRSDNGVRIVRLPLLKPRKHSLTARYAGDSTLKASRSKPVVLKVLR
ncbi:MAG: Ig-like domain repeat protein [Nocardioides sp.]|jgi:hypothetical protein